MVDNGKVLCIAERQSAELVCSGPQRRRQPEARRGTNRLKISSVRSQLGQSILVGYMMYLLATPQERSLPPFMEWYCYPLMFSFSTFALLLVHELVRVIPLGATSGLFFTSIKLLNRNDDLAGHGSVCR